MPSASALVLAGAFAGGLVSGLTGFGTGITALPIWLAGLTPALASPLVVICSLIGQFQTLPAIWHAIDWRRCAPLIAGGLCGVPIGAWLLPYVPLQLFRIGVGLLLIAYCGFSLASRIRFRVRGGGRAADSLVGFFAGILGGIAGLSGPLPTIWARLRDWGKDERRGIFQAFATTILSAAFLAQLVGGLLTLEVWKMVLVAAPGTVLGAWIGRRVYDRLDHAKFDRAVIFVLLLSGFLLLGGGVAPYLR